MNFMIFPLFGWKDLFNLIKDTSKVANGGE